MEPLSAREERKLQDEIARQQKQERLVGQQKFLKEGNLQKQQKRQQDMVQHQKTSGQWLSQLEPAPTFFPTVEQFQDPISYIRSIQTEGSKHGICKIVPPVVPTVPSGLVLDKADGSKLNFSTREQVVQQLRWETLDTARFYDSGKTYTIKDYEKLADDFQRRRFGLAGCLPAKMVEADYWRQMLGSDNPLIEYGNDVEGTAFCSADSNDPLGSSSWNLQILPHMPQSTLRLLKGDAPGVSSPMLYIGMLFATFAWHVEDHYLYSINYQHLGAAKTWYGVPASDADAFEDVAQRHVYTEAVATAVAEGKSGDQVAAAVHSALLGKTTMFTPKLLMDNGIKVRRIVQAPGEFVITFPRAYHGGFSNGFCVGEAVNFSIGDWFPFGLEAAQRYRRLSRLPVLAHDELLCLEGLAIHEEMQQQGDLWQQQAQADMHATLMRCFLHLLREQHAQRAQLLQRGLCQVLRLPFSASMPCCRCKGMMYLAEVVSGDEWSVPVCLACALAYPLQGTCSFSIQLHPELTHLENVAQSFEQLLRQPKPQDSCAVKAQGLGTSGLTETANFGLPHGSLDTGSPLEPFDWSAAPALPPPQAQQDPSSGDPVPEELITCQRDPPEPPRATPSRSGHRAHKAGALRGSEGVAPAGRGGHAKASSSSGRAYTSSGGLPPQLAQTCHSCGVEMTGANSSGRGASQCRECLRANPSTNSQEPYPRQNLPRQNPPRMHTAAASQPANPEPVATRRTPRKRTLSLLDPDIVDPPREARGHARGSREASRDDSSDARDQEAAHFLDGLRAEEDLSGASEDRPFVHPSRGLGKRPSGRWAKLGSDAESPPGKRAKTQVPGVKAANGTYIPPGPMLNSASTRLACLEDVEVDVSAPGSGRRLFRRRVFAPEDSRDERFLTASDVVKGSGFETNTSASNIIDRWTREACAIIVRHNNRNGTDLPMPELPARAYCAGMASSCYVLKAVDVEMLMLPGVLKDDLRANLQRFIADVWPRSSYPPPRGVAGQPVPKEAARSSRAGSTQPQAMSNGHDSTSRRGATQDGGLYSRAASSASEGLGGRAAASSPAPTRVLRKRDPKGRSGAPSSRAKDESHDWDDDSSDRMDAAQGLDVLAGLAETALSEENKSWDLADPPALDLGITASQGRRGSHRHPPSSHTYPHRPQAQPQVHRRASAQPNALPHVQSYAAQNGQGSLHTAPTQEQYAPSLVQGAEQRQLPSQLPVQDLADSSLTAGSNQQPGQDMPVSRHQGQGQQAGQFQLPAPPGRFHLQSQPGQFQGLPQYQGQQPGHPQVQVKQPSQQSAHQYYPHLPNFPQGSSQSSRPGLFQSGQPQGHVQGPDQHAIAQTHRHMLPLQQQQQSMGSLSAEGIIRPRAVRSQGWTMHRGHQQGPAGQLTALPPLQGISLGLTHPQALPVGQSHPYMFGTGPPSVFQGQDGPQAIAQVQRVSQPALPALPSSVLPRSGAGQLAAAPSSIEAPQAASSSAPHVQDDQAMLPPGQSVTQQVQNPPQHSPNISQYGAAHQGPSVPQHGQSMQEHAHSRPQQGHSISQHDRSLTQPGQESSQNRQVMPQPSASETQTQQHVGTQVQQPSHGSAPQDLKRVSPPGPSANAPAASLAREVTAHEGQLQYGVQLMPQHHSQHHAQQQQQPQQRAQGQPSLPQLHATLPVSWEDSQQTTSQANAQSSASALRHGQHPSSRQGFMNGAPPSAAFLGALPSMEAADGAAPNGAAPSPTLRAGGCTGVTVSRQAQAGEQEPRQGQGCEQVKVQDYAPRPLEGPHAAAQRAPQQAQHAHQAQHAQQAATWAVEQLPEGQYVCVMQDGAKLTLEQLYYTLEHVGESLPEDKYEALSMMIKQLTEHGEKYEPQSVPPTSGPQ